MYQRLAAEMCNVVSRQSGERSTARGLRRCTGGWLLNRVYLSAGRVGSAALPEARGWCAAAEMCNVVSRQSGERSTARGLGLVYRRLAAEMERLQATGAERLLDSLLQAMSENKDLEPDELREVYSDHVDSNAILCHLAVVVDSLLQALSEAKDLEHDELRRCILPEALLTMWMASHAQQNQHSPGGKGLPAASVTSA